MGIMDNFSKSYFENVTGETLGDCYRVAGRAVACPHCGGSLFDERRAQLNTSIMTALDLDFLNRSAVTLECVACGHIEWFADEEKVERVDG